MDYYTYETMLEIAEARERINDSLVKLDLIADALTDSPELNESVNFIRETLEFLNP